MELLIKVWFESYHRKRSNDYIYNRKIKETCEQEMNKKYSSWWKGGVSDKYHRNWSFWMTFRWLKLREMFLNSISPFKYLVVVNGQRVFDQHCGEKQGSKAGVLNPRYVSSNMHDPRNLTLKTGGRGRGKEGRQVGRWAARTRQMRLDHQVYDRFKQIIHTQASVCCALTRPALARCWP